MHVKYPGSLTGRSTQKISKKLINAIKKLPVKSLEAVIILKHFNFPPATSPGVWFPNQNPYPQTIVSLYYEQERKGTGGDERGYR